MKATLLSKKMIEKSNLNPLFVINIKQYNYFLLDINRFLCNFEMFSDSGVVLSDPNSKCIETKGKINGDYDNWIELYKMNHCISPILLFEEIKNNSKIINENDDYLEIEYGTYPTKNIDSTNLQELQLKYRTGTIIETDELVPIIIHKDGKVEYAKKYKNISTNEEYVFVCYIDDKLITNIEKIEIKNIDNRYSGSIGLVGPIKWIVDKKTGIAISKTGLFTAEYYDDFETSALKKYLEGQFLIDIGVEKKLEKEEKKSKMPWGEKKKEVPLKEQINKVLMGKHRIPYLVGHPGVGKTAIVKSINKNCLAYNISTFTPDRFTGKTALIPGKTRIIQNEDGTTYQEGIEAGTTSIALPDWYKELIELSEKCKKNEERCVLFLDEFDKLTPNMQVFINGIVDTPRTIANLEIPENVDIIFAGNTEEYSDASFPISGEVESRLTKIEVKPDNINWLSWANKNNVDPLVRAYLYEYPRDIIKDTKINGVYDHCKSLTPRSWDQKISEEIKISRQTKEYPSLEKYMDEEMQKKFEEFMEKYFELGIEQIVSGEIKEIHEFILLDYVKMATMVSCLIAVTTTEEQLENVLTFINKTNNNEFKTLFEKEWSKINNTKEDILNLRTALEMVESEEISYGK